MKFILSFLVLSFLVCCESRKVPRGFDEYILVKVTKVITGDTIEVENATDTTKRFTVTLLDIESPKIEKPFGVAAKEHLEKLLRKGKNKKIGIAIKKLTNKIYGRLYIGRKNINKKMTRDGFAKCYNKKRCPILYRVGMAYAKLRHRGMWAKYSTSQPPTKKESKPKKKESNSSFEKGSVAVSLNRVVDGDTVYVVRRNSNDNSIIKVRMTGIDSPEMKQSFGPEAKNHLETILSNLSNKALTLVIEGVDKYKRSLGIIMSGSVNVNKRMVEDGYAWCYRHKQCPDSYKEAAALAQNKRKGLFVQENPLPPWDWRKQQKS